MKRYKLGLATFGGGLDEATQIEIIKNAGFEAFFTGWNKTTIEAVANRAAQLGMFWQSIHSPFYGECSVKHLWDGGEKGDAVTNLLIECVKDCARFDIPIMVIHPFIGFKDHSPTQAGLDNYAKIIEVANQLDVKLGFENVEGEEYLDAIMKHFWNEPSLGFCYDSGHEMCYNRGRDMLALYGEKLVHTHLNDNLGVRGEDITFNDDLHLMPTDGIADWQSVMERINKTGYDDVIMSELSYSNIVGRNGTVHKYAELSAEEFVSEAYKKITAAVYA